MAIPNRISTQIPEGIVLDATNRLTEVFNLLKPFLLDTLTHDEIGRLAKLGEKSEPFAHKGIEFAQTNTQFTPAWVNIEEAQKDFDYFEALRPIDTLLAQFAKQVANSRIEAGAEVMDAVNDYYKSVKQAHLSGVPAATPLYTELKQRYDSIALGKNKAKQTTHSPTTP